MPVRSLNSPVLKWPDRKTVFQALEKWVAKYAGSRPELLRAGVIGSYARGDWGVGSDLDLILIVKDREGRVSTQGARSGSTGLPFHERGLEWDTTNLPVPVDLLVYTQGEWKEMAERGERFYRMTTEEAVWVFDSSG
jgi:uncharacterized protein